MTICRTFLSLKYLVLGSLAVLFCGNATAQSVVFSRPDMELGFYWEQRDLLLQGDELADDVLRIGFEIRQQGYWSDPRIVAFNYYLRPVFSTREFTPSGRQDIELLNYRIGIDILRGATTPVEMALRSSLSNNDYKATLAGDSNSRVQEHTAEIRWKYAPFPMQFTATEQDYYRKSSSVFSGSTIERNDLNRKLRIRGKSSKLSLNLEHETRENLLNQRVSDLEYDTAKLSHKFNWGKKSQMRSRYDYRRRIKEQEYVSSVFSQFITVQHTENLDSDVEYRFESATGTLDTNILDARYTLNHQLYQNLYSSIFAYDRERTSDIEDFQERGAGIRLDYNKEFFGTRVNLGADFRSSNIDRNTVEGFLEIIDDEYTILPDGKAVLSDRLIKQESVIITDAAGSFVFIRGIDYQLLEFGNGLLIIEIIPGGDLEPGRSILVSYLARGNPSGEYRETLGSYNISISRGGLFFSHYALRTDNELSSGFLPTGLVNRRETHTQLDYGWDTRKGDFLLGLKNDHWEDSVFSMESVTLSGSASFTISPLANASLTLTHQETTTEDFLGSTGADVTGDKLNTVLNNLRLDLDWRLTNTLTITPSVTAWNKDFEYQKFPIRSWDENVISADVELDYRFRKFSASLRIFYNDWKIRRVMPNSDDLRTDDGFQLTVQRSF
jgi:hypothetical protein